MITQHHLQRFARDGIVDLGRVLSEPDIAEARAALARLLAAGALQEEREPELAIGPGEQPAGHLRLSDAWRREPVFERLVFRSDLAGIAVAALGGDVRLLHDGLWVKPEGAAARTFWHQDNAYWQFVPPRAVTLWIALTDALTPESCLWAQPGSHRSALPHRAVKRAWRDDDELLLLDVDPCATRPFPVPAGHAVMHDCLAVHGARAKLAGPARAAFTIHYIAAVIANAGGDCFDDDAAHPRVAPPPPRRIGGGA